MPSNLLICKTKPTDQLDWRELNQIHSTQDGTGLILNPSDLDLNLDPTKPIELPITGVDLESPLPGIEPETDLQPVPQLQHQKPRPDLGPPTQEGGVSSGGAIREGKGIGHYTDLHNFPLMDSLCVKSKDNQYSGSLLERQSLTQSLSRGCGATGYREGDGGSVVKVGLVKNRGKQGGVLRSSSVSSATDAERGLKQGVTVKTDLTRRGGTCPTHLPLSTVHLNLGVFEGDGDNPAKNSNGTCTSAWDRAGTGGGLKPGVTVNQTSGGEGKIMGVPVSHTPNPSTHLSQSTCKGEEPNDPKFISRIHIEGSLSLKPR